MALHIYNSLSHEKERFKPVKDKHAFVYMCGPTVYSFQHIGNYRSYVMWDVLTRTLRFLDYRTTYVMNITDVGHLTDDDLLSSDSGEDKMEKAAKKENKTVWDIAKFYEEDFLEGMDKLHNKRPDTVCRATDHIEQMITMVTDLIEQGHAYVTPSGVYFEISTFPAYGKLSGNTLEDLAAGASGRVEDLSDKRSPHDFALWVLGKEQSMMWDSPWGRGYPGWHVECSAMSKTYLGEHIDIHGGAIDNKFPHHECEIAQSEGAAKNKKKSFVNYWLHAGHVTVDGTKMSKSKGNVYTIADMEEKQVSLRSLRYMFMSSHYRSSFDFSFEAVERAGKSLDTFERLFDRLESLRSEEEGIAMEFSEFLNERMQMFVEALEDDFHTPNLLAHLHEFATELNKMCDDGAITAEEGAAALQMLKTIDGVIEVLFPWEAKAEIPEEIIALAEERLKAKADKNYEESDRLRDEIKAQGYQIEDKPEGYHLSKD